jgi:hypothetical protein
LKKNTLNCEFFYQAHNDRQEYWHRGNRREFKEAKYGSKATQLENVESYQEARG